MSVTRIRLAEGAPEFSRILFGTWRLRDDPDAASPEGLLRRLRQCLDLGITTIDTAEIYGLYRVEEAIGAALQRDSSVKSRMQIVTKAGIYVPNDFHPDRKTAFYDATSRRLVKSCEKSLRFLGVDAIDLFLVHRPDWLTPAEETAAGLNQLLREGKIRSAGVSNFSAAQFRALQSFMDSPLVTNQIQLSPFCLDALFDGTLDLAQELRFHPMAWSPTGGGRLFQPADETAQRLRRAMEEMAPRYGNATPDQLCYAWILAHPSRPAVITGTNKIERLAPLAQSDALTLSREDWYALTEAARGRRIP
jgi:predicted oxidoreductase